MSGFDPFADEPPEVEAEIVTREEELKTRAKLAKRKERMELELSKQKQIAAIEDAMFEKSLGILADTFGAAEIDPTLEDPPQSWIDEFGAAEAVRKYRVARAAWSNKKEAPVFIELSQRFASGVVKSRQDNGQNRVPLNINIVNIVSTVPQFPEQEIEGDK